MRRHEVKECQKTITEYLSKSGFSEVPNGNTPSPLSPTNSVGSQVSSEIKEVVQRSLVENCF